MTKVTKRVVALLTTALLMVGMVVPTMAAVSQPNEGRITLHKLVRTSPGIAHPDNIYSGEELSAGDVTALGLPLQGAGFTLYSLNMTAVNTKINAGFIVTGYTVDTSVTPNEVTFAFDDLSTIMVLAGAPVEGGEKTTNTSGEAVWGGTGPVGNLADGYYLLVETTNPDPLKYTPAEPSVIKSPLTSNSGDENREIHVYPKNIDDSETIVQKKLNGTMNTLEDGDVIKFDIATQFKNELAAPDTVNSVTDLKKTNGFGTNYGRVYLQDALNKYFKYLDSSTTPPATPIDVYLVDGGGNPVTGANALVAADYTLTITPSTPTMGEKIEIELANSGIDKAIAASAVKLGATFSAQYIGGASGGNALTTIENTATGFVLGAIEPTGPVVTPTPGPEITSPPVQFPKVAVEVEKFREDGTTHLAGATFVLTKVAVTTINFDAAKWSLPSGDPDEYTVGQKAQLILEYVCDSTGRPVEATSDATGKLFFNDMEFNPAGSTYYLKETSTVAGYELAAVQTVTFKSLAQYKLDEPSWFDASGDWNAGVVIRVGATVTNYLQGTDKSFSLPLTGGAGTIIFTIAGIMLMAGAVVIYLRGKKKNA